MTTQYAPFYIDPEIQEGSTDKSVSTDCTDNKSQIDIYLDHKLTQWIQENIFMEIYFNSDMYDILTTLGAYTSIFCCIGFIFNGLTFSKYKTFNMYYLWNFDDMYHYFADVSFSTSVTVLS